jgi:hypothetical protein
VSDELEISRLRSELRELGSTVALLRQAGLDSAATQLLLSRKRAALEDLTTRRRPDVSRTL